MNAATPRRAMVLAAGLGLRMRPLTLNRPKPLIRLAGRTLLDRALDALADAGVDSAVVNTHYLGNMIAAHLVERTRPQIRLSPELSLLETGGGVANALPLLGDAPFYVVNADIAWTDGNPPALARLADAWTDEMDALLLVVPVGSATGYDGVGDFDIAPASGSGCGRLARRKAARAPHVFTGVQLLHPRLFDGAPGGAFSLNILYDRAEAAGRLFGIVHDDAWYHVGTPTALAEAEALILRAASRP
jgi:MurNAc alpha-1-phosphate uridylyltransferase